MDSEKQISLSNSQKMPLVGFGTYLISNEEAPSTVGNALHTGYRHVDTAEAYSNEPGVGKALKIAIEELGISREELFVTTKLWPGNSAWGETPKTYEKTIESLNTSLEKLKINHVDLYLIHAPFDKKQRLEQWNALVELRKQGKARAIGVSNFDKNHIEEIKDAGLPLPEVNQIELHPWSQKPELTSYLNENGISVIAYSSLVPLSSWRNAPGQESAKTKQMIADGVSESSPFKTMAKKYNVSEAQVLLRWAIQKGYSVIPKSTNIDRISKNLDLFSFEIDDYDMNAISKMDRGDGVAWSIGDPIKAN